MKKFVVLLKKNSQFLLLLIFNIFFNLVALTSCGVHSSVAVNKDGIIGFPRKIISVCVKHVSSYLSSGKCICEQAGLYHVSVTIMTSNSHTYYEVWSLRMSGVNQGSGFKTVL